MPAGLDAMHLSLAPLQKERGIFFASWRLCGERFFFVAYYFPPEICWYLPPVFGFPFQDPVLPRVFPDPFQSSFCVSKQALRFCIAIKVGFDVFRFNPRDCGAGIGINRPVGITLLQVSQRMDDPQELTDIHRPSGNGPLRKISAPDFVSTPRYSRMPGLPLQAASTQMLSWMGSRSGGLSRQLSWGHSDLL